VEHICCLTARFWMVNWKVRNTKGQSYKIVLLQDAKVKQEFLGRTNLPTFPMAMVAIVTLAKDCMWSNHNNAIITQTQTITVQGWKSCPQLTTLNLNHFNVVEDMKLKINASRSTWMALPLTKYENTRIPSGLEVISGGKHTHTHRQTDWWFD
jgi:hypothetical protein